VFPRQRSNTDASAIRYDANLPLIATDPPLKGDL
jgi:hypothetical protein